jgi:hypothetical protein
LTVRDIRRDGDFHPHIDDNRRALNRPISSRPARRAKGALFKISRRDERRALASTETDASIAAHRISHPQLGFLRLFTQSSPAMPLRKMVRVPGSGTGVKALNAGETLTAPSLALVVEPESDVSAPKTPPSP